MTWRPAHELTIMIVPDEELVEMAQHLASLSLETRGRGTLVKDYNERCDCARHLPSIIPKLAKAEATWRYINSGFQFKIGPTILCWWPRTGSIAWQGEVDSLAPKDRIHPAVDFAVTLTQAKKTKDTTLPCAMSDLVACLVCGGDLVTKTCGKCGRTQADLCESCFPRAHWCLTEKSA